MTYYSDVDFEFQALVNAALPDSQSLPVTMTNHQPSPPPSPITPPASTPTTTTTTTTSTTSSKQSATTNKSTTNPPAKRKARAKKRVWEKDDEMMLLDLLIKHGKGKYTQILEIFHGKHRLDDIHLKEHEKLRVKYNDLKSPNKSKYMQPYIPPPFKVDPRAKLTDDQKRLKEAEYAVAIREEEQMHDEYRRKIDLIEEREDLRGTDDGKVSEDELVAQMEEKGETRRELRAQRLKDYEQAAKSEAEYRKELLQEMKESNKAIAAASEFGKEILVSLRELLQLQLMTMMQSLPPGVTPPFPIPQVNQVDVDEDEEGEDRAGKRVKK